MKRGSTTVNKSLVHVLYTETLFSTAKSNEMARFLMRCCFIGIYWLTSSAPVSGLSDVIEYRIMEGQPANTPIGNVPLDAALHTKYTAQTLTSFRYRLLLTDDGLFAVGFVFVFFCIVFIAVYCLL